MRYWEPEVGPPPLAPPPIETRPSARTLNSSASGASFLHKNMENLSINSSKSSSLGRKEGGEKKKLFKMKWGKDKD
jgi:hypothetical protein